MSANKIPYSDDGAQKIALLMLLSLLVREGPRRLRLRYPPTRVRTKLLPVDMSRLNFTPAWNSANGESAHELCFVGFQQRGLAEVQERSSLLRSGGKCDVDDFA